MENLIWEENTKQKQLFPLPQEAVSRQGDQDRSRDSRRRKVKHGISIRRQNDKLEIKDRVNPLGYFDPEGSLLQNLSILLIYPPGDYEKGQCL